MASNNRTYKIPKTKLSLSSGSLSATGKALGRVSYIVAPINIGADITDYNQGNIDAVQLSIRTSTTVGAIGGGWLVSTIVGGSAGGPTGFAAAVGIGVSGWAVETFYKGFLVPVWNETKYQMYNIEHNWRRPVSGY